MQREVLENLVGSSREPHLWGSYLLTPTVEEAFMLREATETWKAGDVHAQGRRRLLGSREWCCFWDCNCLLLGPVSRRRLELCIRRVNALGVICVHRGSLWSQEICLLDRVFMNWRVHLGHNLKYFLAKSSSLVRTEAWEREYFHYVLRRECAELPEFVPDTAQVSLPSITRDWSTLGVVSQQGESGPQTWEARLLLKYGEAGCFSHLIRIFAFLSLYVFTSWILQLLILFPLVVCDIISCVSV